MPTVLFPDPAIPPTWQERVRAELRDGERLVWVGQPRPGLPMLITLFNVSLGLTMIGIAFGLVVIWAIAFAVAYFWYGVAVGKVLWIFVGATAVPLLIGLWMTSAPFWMWRMAQRTLYVLTDRRAIVWEGLPFGKVGLRSYPPDELRAARCGELPGGIGEIVFESPRELRRGNRLFGGGFRLITQARAVDELIHRTFHNQSPSASEGGTP